MLTENVLISIVIPIYNVEKYIDRCLCSVLEQTYSNLEIILVDDGSKDNCAAICDRYAAKDERIKVIHKQNGGLSSARNAGIAIATGEYIGFVDSDDYIHPRMFEKLLAAAASENAEIAVCHHYTERGKHLLIEDPIGDQTKVFTGKEALFELVEDVNMKSYAWDKLYRLALFEGVRYPEGRNFEDIATTYKLFDKAERICQIPDFLYYYQIREDSISFNDSDLRWNRNCFDSVEGQQERISYFKEKGYRELAEAALGKVIPYIYSCISTGYRVGNTETCSVLKAYLQKNQEEILACGKLSKKNKKLLKVYSAPYSVFSVYHKMKKWISLSDKYTYNLKKRLRRSDKYDFELTEGKTRRLIYFELPCFDNLGDHALAYAAEKFLQDHIAAREEFELFYVDGWDVQDAVRTLKKKIARNDILVCQGGGNIGNLYLFAEMSRRMIMKAFRHNKIIVLPQTIQFTADESGRKEQEKSRRIYNRCDDLLLFARDHHSYEIMEKTFSVQVKEAVDMVSYLDEGMCASKERTGILLCLRSDCESALDTEKKKILQQYCEKTKEPLLISDTVTGISFERKEREAVLKEKWKLFGSVKIVVTDRLHGMMFAMITQTPCVIVGNNYHKVEATYQTVKACKYLYYVSDIEEAGAVIADLLSKKQVSEKVDFGDSFSNLAKGLI